MIKCSFINLEIGCSNNNYFLLSVVEENHSLVVYHFDLFTTSYCYFQAFDCPLHPLGKLMSELIYAFTTTYGGRGLHPRLLHYAVQEVQSFVVRIYDLVRLDMIRLLSIT